MIDYLKAVEDLKRVSKGGKDYATCSFMDISIKLELKETAKKKAIIALGEIAFDKILSGTSNA